MDTPTAIIRPRGFTLIELLVVITIIVALLSLLTPALDKAIYSAEMATCMAHQRGLATGATTYAAAYQRAYPYRLVRGGGGDIEIVKAGANDDRAMYGGYVNLQQFNCPFTETVDFYGSEAGIVWSNYHLFYGFGFNANIGGGAGMYRMGDRIGFTADFGDGPERFRFNLMTGDRDKIFGNDNQYLGSHADKDGVLVQLVLDDEVYEAGDGGGDMIWETAHTINGAAGSRYTLTRWWSLATYERGPIDMNFYYQDGSILRLDDLEVDDERLVPIPVGPGNGNYANGTNLRTYVPQP